MTLAVPSADSLHVISYAHSVLKFAQVAKAIMANSHSMHRINPRGSFNTSVSITVVPMGWKYWSYLVKYYIASRIKIIHNCVWLSLYSLTCQHRVHKGSCGLGILMFGCIFINTSNKYRTEDKIKVKDGNEYNEKCKYEGVVVAGAQYVIWLKTYVIWLNAQKLTEIYFCNIKAIFNFMKCTAIVESLDR